MELVIANHVWLRCSDTYPFWRMDHQSYSSLIIDRVRVPTFASPFAARTVTRDSFIVA
jgi:hypothetical protein